MFLQHPAFIYTRKLIASTFSYGFIKIGLLLCQPVASATILYVMSKTDLF